MQWTFSFSFYIINGFYDPEWNATDHLPPQVIDIDECGPANLLSAGTALWLILVPAVACVVQLPGSVFLFQRSNFYRFSPELGIIDALIVLILMARGVIKGYRWYECIAAVVTVRRGIGRGDLWWRHDPSVATDHEPEAQTNDSNHTVDSHQLEHVEQTTESEHEAPEGYLNPRLKPAVAPLSQERILGAALTVIALVKVVALLATTSNSAVIVTSYLALAYAASYLVLEIMTWVILLPVLKSKLLGIPPENFLELVRQIDPGDNPFTFPVRSNSADQTSVIGMVMLNVVNPVASLTSSLSTSNTTSTGRDYKWLRPVALVVFSLGLLGPLLWILILSHIWSYRSGPWILAVSAVAFLFCRAVGKTIRHRYFNRLKLRLAPIEARIRGRRPFMLYLLFWLWNRCTTVNLYSAIWLGVICYYYASVFPTRVGQGDETVQKPKWLDWLG